jgi:hypothetical protein
MYKDMPRYLTNFMVLKKNKNKIVIVLLEKRAKTEFLGCKF